MDTRPASKIASDELREAMMRDSAEPISVLIQPELPKRTIEIEHVVRGGVEIAIPGGLSSASARDRHDLDVRVVETRGFLEDVLGSPPHWLSSSRTLVARDAGPASRHREPSDDRSHLAKSGAAAGTGKVRPSRSLEGLRRNGRPGEPGRPLRS